MERKEWPLISVIVPVYNGEAYLEKCIRSIKAQTYSNLEILIINDGSTDKTGQICESLAASDPSVRVFALADEGVSAARNKGLAEARGELITFVDADDRLKPETVEILFQNLMQSGSDICGCGFEMWSSEEKWQESLSSVCSIRQLKSYTPAEYLQEELLKGNSRCWSKLYKRSVIGECRFRKDLSIGEDMFFLVELMKQTGKITELDYSGYGYYQNPSGAMRRAFTPRYMEQITCWELARKEVLLMRPQLQDKITSLLIMAILLTAGKLAFLSSRERKEQEQYVEICHTKLKKELQNKEAYRLLSKGYRIKAILFAKAPKLYLGLYHLRKMV